MQKSFKMTPMTSNEIRQRFLEFFKNRGHVILPSDPLVTSDEKGVTNSTLFNTAGMQPLVPYLMGQPHPQGSRLANSQKCIRTVDIDEIGDDTHATFFEMLGNWSLGDYFKKEAIAWSYEFLTSKEEGLGLDPKRLYITVFEGDDNAPKDEAAFNIWQKYVPENRIYFMGAKSNWWSAGDNGPCGPDTEMFYDVTKDGLGDLTKEEFLMADEAQQVVEIWNDVFMQYEKKAGQVIGKLSTQNVDTGSGLERVVMVVAGQENIFQTDLFAPLLDFIKKESQAYNEVSARIVADHIKASVFILSEGVMPSNTDRGYVLRRLIRRAVRHGDLLRLPKGSLPRLAPQVMDIYQGVYFTDNNDQAENIISAINTEENKFRETLNKGFVQIKKLFNVEGEFKIEADFLFDLYQSYGFPIELSIEEINKLRRERGRGNIPDNVISQFNKLFEDHREKSRLGAKEKFAGGLADHSEMSIKYHTTTHLLHQALIDVLGESVEQKGSNVTAERLRFDFSFAEKMTTEQKEAVEKIVNQKIEEDLPVKQVILPKDEALKTGAKHLFTEKYDDEVSIYYIGPSLSEAYSKEFCGGPHTERTGLLGKFKIKKEESVSAGVRRIKAILE